MNPDTAHRDGAIVVDKLSKRYGRKLALDEITLNVGNNELYALLGPNGAGKTTLIHILCTILRPDSGTALLAGQDVAKAPLKARRNIGVVFQEPSLDDRLTARENLDFHGLVYQMTHADRKAGIEEMLALVDLTDWKDALVRTFSGGMKRRLEIARALLHRPRILFLDEPTVGLDAQSRQRIWTYLDQLRRKRNLTVVVTTHYIEEVESCDRVCIIDQGKILAEDTPAALKTVFGQELIRFVPRDADTAELVRSRFPETVDGTGGSLMIKVTDRGFTDQFLAEFGNRARQLSFESPSLENVFLSLTGRELRDRAADERERTWAFGQRGGEHTR